MIDLYRLSQNSWIVTSAVGYKDDRPIKDIIQFTSIEAAADFLETAFYIDGDEVDYAIMEMGGRAHGHAQFRADDGSFVTSDNEKCPDKVGIA